MAHIIGIAGSLRRGSFNASLLRAAQQALPAGSQLDIAPIKDIPLYDGDVEAQGIPAAVAALKASIISADGLLLVSPEYNNSMPGVLKNTIDWLSRPPSDSGKVFGNRPVALMGATPGGFGTVLSQAAWLPVLRTLGTRPWFGGRINIAHADKVFDANGQLLDAALRQQLQTFMQGFCEFVDGKPASK